MIVSRSGRFLENRTLGLREFDRRISLQRGRRISCDRQACAREAIFGAAWRSVTRSISCGCSRRVQKSSVLLSESDSGATISWSRCGLELCRVAPAEGSMRCDECNFPPNALLSGNSTDGGCCRTRVRPLRRSVADWSSTDRAAVYARWRPRVIFLAVDLCRGLPRLPSMSRDGEALVFRKIATARPVFELRWMACYQGVTG